MADESPEDAPGAAEEELEHFRPTGGRVTGLLGLVVAGAVVVLYVLDRGSVPAPVAAVALVAAVLVWASLLRPRVSASAETLVLRNMLETVSIPLAAVDEIVVRQVMAVRVADKKFVSPALGRKLRKMMKAPRPPQLIGPNIPDSIEDAVGPAADGPQHLTYVDYADYVEARLRELVERARVKHGVRRYSDEAEALAAGVRREPAWTEIGAIAAGLLVLVVTLVS